MTQVFGSMSFSPFCAAFVAIKSHVQQSINTSQISKLADCLLSRPPLLSSPLETKPDFSGKSSSSPVNHGLWSHFGQLYFGQFLLWPVPLWPAKCSLDNDTFA